MKGSNLSVVQLRLSFSNIQRSCIKHIDLYEGLQVHTAHAIWGPTRLPTGAYKVTIWEPIQ